MSRYSKAWVALLGVAAQIAVVAADAQDQDLIPSRWQPWVTVGIALATALGVRQVPNAAMTGRHIAGPLPSGGDFDAFGSDSGRVRVSLAMAAAGMLLLVAILPASAAPRAGLRDPDLSPRSARQPVLVEHVRTGGVWACGAVLLVSYDVERLVAMQWQPELDDGRVGLEVEDLSGRSWPHGIWVPAESVKPGGEHWLRWPLADADKLGMNPVAARVTRGGAASVSRPIEPGCPA